MIVRKFEDRKSRFAALGTTYESSQTDTKAQILF